jgi:hypothetical protein
MLGRDGWLFLRRDSNDLVGQLTGKVQLSSEDRERFARLFDGRMRVAAELRAGWLAAVVPNKEVVYAEHLPSEVVLAEQRPVHDVLAIAAAARAPVVYLLDDLLAAKSLGELYMRTDTHWNHLGGYVAYRAICRELGARDYHLKVLKEHDLEWSAVSSALGDLGVKLYPELFESPEVLVRLKARRGRRTYDNGVSNYGRVQIHEQEAADGPTCVVFGDSFVHTLLPYLAESFRRVVFVHTSMFVREILERERPDVVLTVTIERFLVRVPNDAIAFADLRTTVRAKGGELPWCVEDGPAA